MSISVPKVKLNDGTSIPAIGFGTGTALYGKECADLVLTALKTGYRYLDSAQGYSNAESISDALRRWDGKREDVYILTKMGKDSAPKQLPRDVLVEQLKLLGVDHVDLFLVHANFFAYPSLKENWKAMEELVKEGLTKSIGVSNYAADDIEELSKSWTIPPAVNQLARDHNIELADTFKIEYNPYIYHPDYMLRLRSVLDKHDIKIQAYAPMISLTYATDGPVSPVVKKIADSKGATEAQVLLAWAHQYGGGCAVTTSRNEQRQKEQLESLSKVTLSRSELDEIAEAGKGKTVRKYMHKAWQGKE